MSTARRYFNNTDILTYTVAAAKAATAGFMAILASDDTAEDGGAASAFGVGVFKATAVAGARVGVYCCNGIWPVVVGTGDATRGTKAIFVADGFTDAPVANAAGATTSYIYGTFMQSGVAGDIVGLDWGKEERITA